MTRALVTALAVCVLGAGCGRRPGDLVTEAGDTGNGSPVVRGLAVTGDGTALLVATSAPDPEGRRCWKPTTLALTPTATAVELRVVAEAVARTECPPTPWRVPLTEALAGRPVVDATTHAELPLLPVAVPEPTWLPDGWRVIDSFGTADGWDQRVGVPDTLQSVEIKLAGAAPDVNLQAATVVRTTTVQGREAALVSPRYATDGSHWLVVEDARWRMQLWPAGNGVADDVVARIADGLRPFPIAATAGAPTIAPARTGSVGELLDYEGPAVVTGWLSVDRDDRASLCDRLAADGACDGPTMEVDWRTGNAAPPDGLVASGARRVSAAALELDGTVKGRIFFVGV